MLTRGVPSLVTRLARGSASASMAARVNETPAAVQRMLRCARMLFFLDWPLDVHPRAHAPRTLLAAHSPARSAPFPRRLVAALPPQPVAQRQRAKQLAIHAGLLWRSTGHKNVWTLAPKPTIPNLSRPVLQTVNGRVEATIMGVKMWRNEATGVWQCV